MKLMLLLKGFVYPSLNNSPDQVDYYGVRLQFMIFAIPSCVVSMLEELWGIGDIVDI